jgi:hypothetical protein
MRAHENLQDRAITATNSGTPSGLDKIASVIEQIMATEPVYEMVIDGDSYTCPLPEQVTVGEYDRWIDYIRRHPQVVVPDKIKHRRRKTQRFLRLAHYARRASFFGYWWGIDKNIAILLPAEQMEAMVAAASMTACPVVGPSDSILLNKSNYTICAKTLGETDLRLVSSVASFLRLALISEYGERLTTNEADDIPLDKAFQVLRSVAQIGKIGNNTSRADATNFLASIVYTLSR